MNHSEKADHDLLNQLKKNPSLFANESLEHRINELIIRYFEEGLCLKNQELFNEIIEKIPQMKEIIECFRELDRFLLQSNAFLTNKKRSAGFVEQNTIEC